MQAVLPLLGEASAGQNHTYLNLKLLIFISWLVVRLDDEYISFAGKFVYIFQHSHLHTRL